MKTSKNNIIIGNTPYPCFEEGSYNIFLGNYWGEGLKECNNILCMTFPAVDGLSSSNIRLKKKISKLQWYLFRWIISGATVELHDDQPIPRSQCYVI